MIYRVVLLTIALVFTFGKCSYSQEYSEYEVKLVYIYQFVKYFNWPADDANTTEKFTIGIYGSNTLGDLPAKMFENRKFNGKECEIIQLKSAVEAKNCNLIFVMGVKKFEAMQLLKAISKYPVLTIGDQLDEFCQIGGMINFTDKSEHFRLELNPENVHNASLQISKQLFSISKVIENEEAVF